jgi:hypothetical protein
MHCPRTFRGCDEPGAQPQPESGYWHRAPASYSPFRFFPRAARRISLYSFMSSSSEALQAAIIASRSLAAARIAPTSAFRLRLWAGMKKPSVLPWRVIAKGRPPSRWPDSRAPLLPEWRATSPSAVLTASASFSTPTGARILNASLPTLAVTLRPHGRYAARLGTQSSRQKGLWFGYNTSLGKSLPGVDTDVPFLAPMTLFPLEPPRAHYQSHQQHRPQPRRLVR